MERIGTSAAPKQPENVVEFIYDKPIIYKKVFALFKAADAKELTFVFDKTEVRVITSDHREKAQREEDERVDVRGQQTESLPKLEAGNCNQHHRPIAAGAAALPFWRIAKKYRSSRSASAGSNDASGR